MKNIIKKILVESQNEKIINLLKKRFDLSEIYKIENFLFEAGYKYTEIKEIYYQWFEMESGYELNPINWMNYNYSTDQLEVVKDNYDDEYKDSIFFRKNGKVVMEQDDMEKQFWFDDDKIWSFIQLFFDMDYEHTYNILGYWLKNTLKLNKYNPIRKAQIPPIWKRLSN
jgi:hypothetical protein